MAVADDRGDNRPPPTPRQRFSLTTPGIPWYRDIKVIRILMQVTFAILFVGGLTFAFANLLNNLDESNLSLDFGIYQAPFTVAISEGPSVTSNWAWLQEDDAIQVGYWVIWLVALAVTSFSAIRQYRRGQIPYTPGTILLLLLAFIAFVPPNEMPQTLRDYFYGGSMARAFFTGIANTLKVVVASLFACTILGVLAGIGLLSSNFLVRTVSKVYVEIFRNTPLLIQLLFIYRTLTLLLPRPRQSICMNAECTGSNLYALNTRGLYLVSPQPTDTAPLLLLAVVLGLAIAWFVRRQRLKRQEETGEPAQVVRFTLPVLILFPLVGWVIASLANDGGLFNGVFINDYPILPGGPNIEGGTQVTTAFFALFAGLTLYTAAFIADIVRAGIQAVPYGQIEAARSQGLKGSQVLNLIILPQALRLIIPPLGNQYVNLGKNSSLAIAVTYFDTYQIAQLANNESGQAVPFFVGLMVIYLSLSLVLSLLTNFANRATQVKTR